ncbi:uncharacterized protein LOC144744887 [Ciona intestinalis]
MESENAVAVKLPAFWCSQPRVWFLQSESQFQLKRVTTDKTKFYHVVSALDQDTACRLMDILEQPPDRNTYEAIKRRLLHVFDLPRLERAARLINMPPSGERKPSALIMDETLALLGNLQPCLLFKYLFLQHMPEDIRPVLAGEDIKDSRKLARIADLLWHARNTRSEFSVSKTKKQVVKQADNDGSGSTGVCYYHRWFGHKARRCYPPCSYSETPAPVAFNGWGNRYIAKPFLCEGPHVWTYIFNRYWRRS